MKTLNKIITKVFDIEVFKLVFFVSCFFYCIPFTNALLVKVFKGFILWGAATFLYNFIKNKRLTLKKPDYLIFAFIALAGIGCFVNFRSRLVDNVVAVAYMVLQTVLMLCYNRPASLEEKAKEIKRFSSAAVYLTFPCAVLSLLIFLLNFKYSFRMGFMQYVFGVFEGRLWGVQGNPNSLAQFALVSLWASLGIIFINRRFGGKKSERVFHIVNIVLEVICIVLSNSRSTVIGASVAVVAQAVVLIGLKARKENSVLSALFKTFLPSAGKIVCVVVCVLATSVIVKQGMRIISLPFKNIDMDYLQYYDDEPEEEDGEDEHGKPGSNKVDREYLTDDYSNGRFELWQGAAKVAIKNPLFGVGVKNINERVNEHMSDFTLSVTPKLSENMHNIYIQVIVAHGALAFICFAAYLIIVVLKNLKFLFGFNSDNENNKLIFKLVSTHFCLIGSFLIVNLFDSNILYFCSIFLVPAFWNSISTINGLIDCLEREDDKKKVLLMVDSLEAGGTEKALIDLTSSLDYSKYELHVITLYNEGQYIKSLHPEIIYSSVIKKPNIWKKRIFYRLVKYLPVKLLYQFIVRENYDTEIAFHELLSTKILCGSDSRAAKIAWIHTNVFANEGKYQMFSSFRRFVRGYDSFDRIVCVSDNLRAQFDERTKLYQKTETVYNPINSQNVLALSKEECEIEKRDGSFLLISTGRLEPVKGYDRLLRAFSAAAKNHPELDLWIIGDGSQKAALEGFVAENGLENRVKLLGYQQNPYKYMSKADLFVSSSDVEGFGIALAEAIVLGLPVISTETDGPREILGHGEYGMLIPFGDDDMRDAIEKVVSDRALLEDLRNKSALRRDYFGRGEAVERFDALMSLKDLSRETEEGAPFCTVFTPAYNRGYIIEKLYESLKAQTDKDFEWVVVDDGSTDNTEELFSRWGKEENGFKINYIKTENGGKQRAVNRGLSLARGKMFFIVDSDDALTENAIERLRFYESDLPEGFAGIAGLKGFGREEAIGGRGKQSVTDATNLEREKFDLLGDKAECYYTELLRKYRFPEIEGEKFVTECVVWDKIAADGYKLRWFSEIIYLGEYLEDGLTSDGMALHHKNPTGYLLYVRNEDGYYPFDIKRKIGNYFRYYSIVKEKKTLREIADDLVCSGAFLRSVVALNRLMGKKQ